MQQLTKGLVLCLLVCLAQSYSFEDFVKEYKKNYS